jgi:predicted membrane-bound dolichyl-phosphate-mannose-protein mannosyltransferase
MGASDRGPSVTWRPFGAARGLLAILAVGLAFRLIIAYVLLPGSGFGVDRASFIGWANDLAAHGPSGFYSRVSFIDYTPGYLYVLWLLGVVGNWLGGLGDLIKLPAILADVAVGYLVHQLVVELGGSRRAALLGAILFVVNPVTWFDSAVWAQVDSFGLIFLLLGLRELWRDHPETAAILATIAAVIKPQLGILVPILVAVLLKRHLIDPLRRRSGTDQQIEPEVRSGRLGRGPIRLVTSGLLALGTAAALCAPFGLSIVDLLIQVGKTAGGYPYITVNAYNPWALIQLAGSGLAVSGTWLPDIANPTAPGTPVTILGIPAVFIGTALLLATIGLVAAIVARRDDRRTILVGLTVLAIAFFVVPTRVHERYLFPFFALGAILAATSFRWRLAYLALALANFANLYAVLTTPFYNNPGISDWLGVGDTIRSQTGVTIAALTHLAVGLWALTELRRGAQVRLDAQTAADALEDKPPATAGEELGWGAPPAPGLGVGSGPAPGPGVALAPRVARLASPAPATRMDGAPAFAAYPEERGRLRGLLNRRPRLADRSRGLWSERGGRLDKLDLLIMTVLLVGVLTLRLFRLSDPYEFHFDEVYHARTAMEFLQDWRYGIPHDIYEFTHPHLAKYAMAEGITYLGDNKVTATAQLGGSISAILVEPRWDDANLPNARAGDRFYVAGGDLVRVYDLATRDLIATYNVTGAQALALDSADHRIFIGTATGVIATIDTTEELDPLRTSSPPAAPNGTHPATLANLGVGITELWVSSDGSALVAGTAAADVVAVDPTNGTLGGKVHVDGLADFADGGSANGLVAAPSVISDPTAQAKTIAGITGLDATAIESRLRSIANESGETQAVVLGTIPAAASDAIGTAISGGQLTGFAIRPLPEVAAAGRAGVTFIAGTTGEKDQLIATDAAATGLADVVGIDTTPKLYVAQANEKVAQISIDDTSSGTITAPSLLSTFGMPGQVSRVAFDAATKMVHILGRTPDGSAETVYVVEPHANATYADAQLPFTSVAWAMDATHDYPSSDREALLVASADGTIASIDVGGDPFAWRFPGVIAGALTALLLYLLARILFKRRSIAVLVGILVAVDGMFFVQSRIAMNDVYVGLFIVAAYTLFAAVWTGWWRWRWAWLVALPVVGVLLGLALASKWVGLYAIAGVGILILGRSALGRIILILGLIGGTVVLGNIALTALPALHPTSGPNYIFVFVMVGMTLAAVLHAVLRPVAWTDDETRLAIAGPAGLGILLFLGAIARGIATTPYTFGSITVQPIEIAAALIVSSGIIYLVFRLAGSFGLGPLTPPLEPTDPLSLAEPAAPAPPGWLRLGWGFGIPIAWMVASLLVLPLVVYVVSYLPWVALGNRLTDTWPPGHTGQTLIELTKSMYDYHNNLRATHPASSPFWAWPLDLKPVWFYQGSFAGNTSAAIYDNGNLVTWWLEIPAIAFVAWQAFKRGSLALGLITIGFVLQWVPWLRIDRATFQYHYYTSLPFLVLALAYFLAELWHGASSRTWLLARVSAAVAILGPALLWAFKGPLCGYVRVDAANPGSGACVDSTPGDLLVTVQAAGLALVMIVAGILLIAQVLRLRRGGNDRRLAQIVATAVGAVAAVLAVRSFLPATTLIDQAGFSTAPIAFVILAILLPIAWVVLTARDARRFVAGVIAAATVFFVAFYPNIAALPLPSAVFNAYQGMLPTWLYPFQFPDNIDVAAPSEPLLSLVPILTLVMLTVLCVVVGYSAWSARIPRSTKVVGGGDDEDSIQPLAGGGA